MAEIHHLPNKLTFDDFWPLYPRKVAKLAARKAWDKALREDSAENIIAGLKRFNRHLPEDKQFIPYPATWLNQGRWMDEYESKFDKPLNIQKQSLVIRSGRWWEKS